MEKLMGSSWWMPRRRTCDDAGYEMVGANGVENLGVSGGRAIVATGDDGVTDR